MLEYDELKPKTYITLDEEIYEVLEAQTMGKQQRKPVNQTKLRHVRSGKVIERTFHQSETIAEADTAREAAEFIYTRGDQAYFCIAGDPSQRFALPLETIGDSAPFLKNGLEVEVLLDASDTDQPYAHRVLGVRLPIKAPYTVTEAPPNVRGNTAQGGDKQVTIETGTSVTAPLFIEQGEQIIVNTQTGEYVSRA